MVIIFEMFQTSAGCATRGVPDAVVVIAAAVVAGSGAGAAVAVVVAASTDGSTAESVLVERLA